MRVRIYAYLVRVVYARVGVDVGKGLVRMRANAIPSICTSALIDELTSARMYTRVCIVYALNEYGNRACVHLGVHTCACVCICVFANV